MFFSVPFTDQVLTPDTSDDDLPPFPTDLPDELDALQGHNQSGGRSKEGGCSPLFFRMV